MLLCYNEHADMCIITVNAIHWTSCVPATFQLEQPSLGMPSREYYLSQPEGQYRKAYLRYMVNLACLLGANRTQAETDMADVLHFETQLANVGNFFSHISKLNASSFISTCFIFNIFYDSMSEIFINKRIYR